MPACLRIVLIATLYFCWEIRGRIAAIIIRFLICIEVFLLFNGTILLRLYHGDKNHGIYMNYTHKYHLTDIMLHTVFSYLELTCLFTLNRQPFPKKGSRGFESARCASAKPLSGEEAGVQSIRHGCPLNGVVFLPLSGLKHILWPELHGCPLNGWKKGWLASRSFGETLEEHRFVIPLMKIPRETTHYCSHG